MKKKPDWWEILCLLSSALIGVVLVTLMVLYSYYVDYGTEPWNNGNFR